MTKNQCEFRVVTGGVYDMCKIEFRSCTHCGGNKNPIKNQDFEKPIKQLPGRCEYRTRTCCGSPDICRLNSGADCTHCKQE